MAEFTRLPRSEVEAIAAQVKANHAKLAGCPWHEFERIPRPDDAVLAGPQGATRAHRSASGFGRRDTRLAA